MSYTAANTQTVWLEQRTLHKSRRRQAGSAVGKKSLFQAKTQRKHQGNTTAGWEEHNRWLDGDWTKIPTKLTRGWGAGGVKRGNTDELEWVGKTQDGGKSWWVCWSETLKIGQMPHATSDFLPGIDCLWKMSASLSKLCTALTKPQHSSLHTDWQDS